MIFINKMDKIGADFYASVQSVKDRLGGNALEMQLPIGAEDQFKGVVDLVKNVAYVWEAEADLGASIESGVSSEAGRVVSSPVFTSIPAIAGISSGDGK